MQSISPVSQATSQNATVSISTVSTSTKPTSSAPKINDAENQIYVKRGSVKRKADTLMEEAVTAIKTLCQPNPNISPDSNSSIPTDSAQTLGLFIAARLHEMTSNEHKQCENELLKVLSQF